MLQLLNLSICSQSYWEYYNYSSHANTYDPTETIVEWVVEMKKGNQDVFSYTNSINLKGFSKTFSWHIDIPHHLPLLHPMEIGDGSRYCGDIAGRPRSICLDIISPPPEHFRIA
jgi:hypothetical protein